MAMNFPSAPAEGAIYQAPGGPTYKFIGGLWVPQQGSGVFLEKANNLSDVSDKGSARDNLGLLWKPWRKDILAADAATMALSLPAGARQIRIHISLQRILGVSGAPAMRWGFNGDGSVKAGASDYNYAFLAAIGANPPSQSPAIGSEIFLTNTFASNNYAATADILITNGNATRGTSCTWTSGAILQDATTINYKGHAVTPGFAGLTNLIFFATASGLLKAGSELTVEYTV